MVKKIGRLLLIVLCSPFILVWIFAGLLLVTLFSPLLIVGYLQDKTLYKRIRAQYAKDQKYIFVFKEPTYKEKYLSDEIVDKFKKHMIFDDTSLCASKTSNDLQRLARVVIGADDDCCTEENYEADTEDGWRYCPVGIVGITPSKVKKLLLVETISEDKKDEEKRLIKELQEVIDSWSLKD